MFAEAVSTVSGISEDSWWPCGAVASTVVGVVAPTGRAGPRWDGTSFAILKVKGNIIRKQRDITRLAWGERTCERLTCIEGSDA